MTLIDSQDRAQITNVCCIGAGYVGGPTCAVISAKCPEISVTVVDNDTQKIAAWNSDEHPVYEPGLKELVKRQRHKNLTFSTDIRSAIHSAQMIIIAVGTPPIPAAADGTGGSRGLPTDLRAIEQCAQTIAQASLESKIVVSKSTVPCGTSSKIQQILDKYARPGVRFNLLTNPEFLSEGTAIQDLLLPDRVIIGCSPLDVDSQWAQNQLKQIYLHWVPEHKILTMDRWSSELTKLTSNAMLAQRISSINSVSAICEATGADITKVAAGCGMDTRLGPRFLRASLGFGGSCFHKDVASLVWLCRELGLPEVAEYWHQVLVINDLQTKRFGYRIIDTLAGDRGSSIQGRRVACLGFAYKEGTGDTRNTPAADVCRLLVKHGAHISIYDPKVPRHHILEKLDMDDTDCSNSDTVLICDGPYSAIAGSEAVVVLTAWNEFRHLDWKRVRKLMRPHAYIFDGQVLLDHSDLCRLGFRVVSVGKKHNGLHVTM
ncbi:hypothetical protein GGF40_003953 [Coemansia sp. RSA 1286]|nr:hypothetical protein GGF40_003953 [Coemansia sp. RSA 1286]